ncbi:fumarylacetoacetate hydrolase family protein [Nitratireductor soli]|uniref:fumarylacetoacetate hydrolase family protein n=1 Tax=Nitratireductor soli TaxID=1670619 RepID=UPI00065E983A|nr:fumarylacetoacetate hydrolase family protein [Nitratireductor soli]
MKLATYRTQGQVRYGAVIGNGIVSLSGRFGAWPTLAAALDAGGISALADAASGRSPDIALDAVTILPPIPDPRKIICIGLNYRTHILETGRDTPTHPMLFARYPDSLVGHGEEMLRPLVSDKYDFEGELAIVIGRTARHVAAEDALGYVAGYSCFNDGSVRDYQRQTTQFLAGKTFWRSGAFGPWLVTPDEVGDVARLTLETRLNGAVMQRAETADLLFSVADLIAFISRITPLYPGDVIATGTTGGIGAARKPPVWMKPGDRVEVEISNIGTLANPIADEKATAAPAGS